MNEHIRPTLRELRIGQHDSSRNGDNLPGDAQVQQGRGGGGSIERGQSELNFALGDARNPFDPKKNPEIFKTRQDLDEALEKLIRSAGGKALDIVLRDPEKKNLSDFDHSVMYRVVEIVPTEEIYGWVPIKERGLYVFRVPASDEVRAAGTPGHVLTDEGIEKLKRGEQVEASDYSDFGGWDAPPAGSVPGVGNEAASRKDVPSADNPRKVTADIAAVGSVPDGAEGSSAQGVPDAGPIEGGERSLEERRAAEKRGNDLLAVLNSNPGEELAVMRKKLRRKDGESDEQWKKRQEEAIPDDAALISMIVEGIITGKASNIIDRLTEEGFRGRVSEALKTRLAQTEAEVNSRSAANDEGSRSENKNAVGEEPVRMEAVTEDVDEKREERELTDLSKPLEAGADKEKIPEVAQIEERIMELMRAANKQSVGTESEMSELPKTLDELTKAFIGSEKSIGQCLYLINNFGFNSKDVFETNLLEGIFNREREGKLTPAQSELYGKSDIYRKYKAEREAAQARRAPSITVAAPAPVPVGSAIPAANPPERVQVRTESSPREQVDTEQVMSDFRQRNAERMEASRERLAGLLLKEFQEGLIQETNADRRNQLRRVMGQGLFRLGLSVEQAIEQIDKINDPEDNRGIRQEYYLAVINLGNKAQIEEARKNSNFADFEKIVIDQRTAVIEGIKNSANSLGNGSRKEKKQRLEAIINGLFRGWGSQEDFQVIINSIGDQNTQQELRKRFFKEIKGLSEEYTWVKEWKGTQDYKDWEKDEATPLWRRLFGMKPAEARKAIVHQPDASGPLPGTTPNTENTVAVEALPASAAEAPAPSVADKAIDELEADRIKQAKVEYDKSLKVLLDRDLTPSEAGSAAKELISITSGMLGKGVLSSNKVYEPARETLAKNEPLRIEVGIDLRNQILAADQEDDEAKIGSLVRSARVLGMDSLPVIGDFLQKTALAYEIDLDKEGGSA